MKKLLHTPYLFLYILVLSYTTSVLAQSPNGISNNLQLWLKSDIGLSLNGTHSLAPEVDHIVSWRDQSSNGFIYRPYRGTAPHNSGSIYAERELEGGIPTFYPRMIILSGTRMTTLEDHPEHATLDYETGAVYVVVHADNNPSFGNFSRPFGDLLGNDNEIIRFNQHSNTLTYGYTEENVADRTFRLPGTTDPFQPPLGQILLIKILFDDTIGTYTISQTFNGTTITSSQLDTPISDNRGIPIYKIGPGMFFDFFEIIVYGQDKDSGGDPLNTVINSTDRDYVEGYLALKYGISLDKTSGYSYVNSSGDPVYTYNGTHDHAIMCIGKDSGAGLDNRIATSLNNGSVLTLSTDMNSTGFNHTHTDILTDGQYLVFASDNGDPNTATSTEFDGTLVGSRIDREWRVENTGNVGAVVLTFNGFNSDYLLITDSDGDFTSGASITGALDEDGKISVTLNDNSYFTLATRRTTTWNGSTSSDWDDAANWSDGFPSLLRNVIISNVGNAPSIVAVNSANFHDLTIDSGATLTLQNGGSLTLNGKLTNNGTLIANSGSSILLSGTHSGNNITYNRTLDTNNWYLISSPVEGQDTDDFIAASGLASGTGNNLGFASYSTSTDTWSYYQNGTSDASTLTSGKGYSIKPTVSGAIAFNGIIRTSDITDLSLDATGEGFNLLGNPFPSFLNGTSFLTANTSALASETLYLWNQSTNKYETHVTVDNFKVAPSQGFFVKQNGSQTTVSFNKDWQSHESTDTFQRNTNLRPEVHLTVSNGTEQMTTKIYYIDGATTGFDNGYDGALFSGVPYNFAVFTRLADGSNPTINYDIQSLPNSNHVNMIIPLGIIADSGTEITFTAELMNALPQGVPVILEDRVTNTFTRMDEIDASYVVSLNENLSGIGRFYLHTNTQEALSNDQHENTSISIYPSDNGAINIVGLDTGKTSLTLYNLMGQEVFKTVLESTGDTTVRLPKSLSTGVFIVQLERDKIIIGTKKIIIK